MTHADLQFAYQVYRTRFRELFANTPPPSFDDWLDDRAVTAARERAEGYMQALGAEGACVEWAEGYLAARSEE